MAPFQEKTYEKLVAAVLEGRHQGSTKVPTLNVGDLVLLLDAGRAGNAKGLKKYWMVPDPEGSRLDSMGHPPCVSSAGSQRNLGLCWDTLF